MKSMNLARISLTAFLIVLYAARVTAQRTPTQPSYRVIDLGTLGGTFSEAFGINNKGQVQGFSTLPRDTAVHAFVWQNGVMTDLGTLGGPNSQAFPGPNERGQAVGLSETSTPDPKGEDFCGLGTHLTCLPFLWQAGVMKALDTLGGNNGQAGDNNNRGEVVGFAETAAPDPVCPAPQVLQFKPAIWEKGEIQELPTFPGDSDGVAFGINDRGHAVGASGSCAAFDPEIGAPLQPLHALLWQNGTVTDLGNLGGTMNNVAFILNNQGQVVGTSGVPDLGRSHAFLWQDGVMTDLGTLPGDLDSGAVGINNRGQVVGISVDASGSSRAFLWQNGVMTDLNTLISGASPFLFLLHAPAINSRGEIVGFGLTSSGDVHAYLAIPNHGNEGIAPGVAGRPSGSPKIALSEEDVRKLLQQVRLGRFGIRSLERK